MKKNKNKLGYQQSFLIVIVLLLTGFIVEFITPQNGIKIPGYPVNLVILAVFVVYILGLHFFWKSNLKKWLSSVPATIGAITGYSILVLIMGFIPQTDIQSGSFIQLIGLTHLNKSWVFLFMSVYLLIILGFVILRRLKKFDFKNIAFFINHTGIWLVIVTASLGTGDLHRFTMPIQEQQINNLAYQNDTTIVEMPFAVELKSFEIQEYDPQLIFFNPYTKEIQNDHSTDYFVELNKSISHEGKNYKIAEYIRTATKVENGFIEKDTIGSEYAVLLEYDSKKSWISSGSHIFPSTADKINKNLAVSLSLPQEKEYKSTINVYFPDGTKHENVELKVNKPFKIAGYKIYQQGFDNSKGKWSDVSILEIVRDPWLPVVYVGLIMLVIGSFMLFWLGKKR